MKKVEVKVWSGFELDKSVCNHGFFMMAPNRWIPSTKTLVRPLRLPDDHSSITVSISQPSPTSLSITVLDDDHVISLSHHQAAIVDQVKRMLRLSEGEEEKVNKFHRIHVDAAKRGFGRLFRNPSLFEDIVKSLLLCGCNFQRSLAMAERLCVLQKRINTKTKHRTNRKDDSWGNFPSAQELASSEMDECLLSKSCKLGYRARPILLLAKAVTDGEIRLHDFENHSCDGNELLYRKLMKINGVGEFVACNILMCMGFYHKIPIDSETIRHIKQIHQRKECGKKNVKTMVKEIYDKYDPFQTLAYWLELVEYYENNLGKLSLLERRDYKRVTGSIINNDCRN